MRRLLIVAQKSEQGEHKRPISTLNANRLQSALNCGSLSQELFSVLLFSSSQFSNFASMKKKREHGINDESRSYHLFCIFCGLSPSLSLFLFDRFFFARSLFTFFRALHQHNVGEKTYLIKYQPNEKEKLTF